MTKEKGIRRRIFEKDIEDFLSDASQELSLNYYTCKTIFITAVASLIGGKSIINYGGVDTRCNLGLILRVERRRGNSNLNSFINIILLTLHLIQRERYRNFERNEVRIYNKLLDEYNRLDGEKGGIILDAPPKPRFHPVYYMMQDAHLVMSEVPCLYLYDGVLSTYMDKNGELVVGALNSWPDFYNHTSQLYNSPNGSFILRSKKGVPKEDFKKDDEGYLPFIYANVPHGVYNSPGGKRLLDEYAEKTLWFFKGLDDRCMQRPIAVPEKVRGYIKNWCEEFHNDFLVQSYCLEAEGFVYKLLALMSFVDKEKEVCKRMADDAIEITSDIIAKGCCLNREAEASLF